MSVTTKPRSRTSIPNDRLAKTFLSADIEDIADAG
jgi:hypothetical protein